MSKNSCPYLYSKLTRTRTRLLGHPVPGCDDLHEHGEIVENVSAEPPLLTVVVETGPAHTAGSRLFKATRTNRP